MKHWLRLVYADCNRFDILDAGILHVCRGPMSGHAAATEQTLALDAALPLPLAQRWKLIGLRNKSHAMAEKLGQTVPAEALYVGKASNSYLPHDGTSKRPFGHEGKAVCEVEPGIVIGQTCGNIDAVEAISGIFGYTCVNDVTALELPNRDASLAQWTSMRGGNVAQVTIDGIDCLQNRIEERT